MRQSLRFLLFGPLLLLTACSGQSLQQALQTDPNLQPDAAVPVARCSEVARSRLPQAFPTSFCYPNAELQQVIETTLDEGVAVDARWSTEDSAEQVRAFYQQALDQGNWEITSGANAAPSTPLEAVKEGIRVAIAPAAGEASATPFTVSYRPVQRAQTEDDLDIAAAGPDASDPETANVPSSTGETDDRRAAQSFSDIDEAPEEFQDYIRDLAALGVLDAAEGNQFRPDATVTRRTFARWLFNANNAFFTESAKRIRAAAGDESAFQDLSSSNPDFEEIQGLANAGLIPSPLSGESTLVNFRPDAPLTRETLLQWKVPLDLRRSLPNATVDAVKQTWGFQDATKIDPKALQAVLADHANGNQSNIRRAFGFTTLFQPQKPVTRAEAAAALWHFGYQGDGLSADEVRREDTAEASADEDVEREQE